jgi:hypothetical protein
MARAAAIASIARTRATMSTTARSLRAAIGPMLTWSSLPADVGMVSTLAGKLCDLHSLASAAAVTCIIM